jgi:glyoxylase I family protein
LAAINHIDLTVADLELSRRFYEPVMKYLGFRISSESPKEVVFQAADNRFSIALFPARAESRDKAHDRYAPGLHHLAFDAQSREEVDGMYRLLKEIGAEILDPPAVYYPPDYYATFFRDPDGIKLELAYTPSLY